MTYDECTSKYIDRFKLYVGGHMTQDEQYCVLECDEIYKPDSSSTEKICTCAKFIAPNGKSCMEECGTDQHAIDIADSEVKQCVCNDYLGPNRQSCVEACADNQTETLLPYGENKYQCTCTLLGLNGKDCAEKCGAYQTEQFDKINEYTRCVCVDTFHKTEDNSSCVCDGYLSVGDNVCLTKCKNH